MSTSGKEFPLSPLQKAAQNVSLTNAYEEDGFSQSRQLKSASAMYQPKQPWDSVLNKLSPQPTRIKKKDNCQVTTDADTKKEVERISATKDSTLKKCAEACLNDKDCVMFSFGTNTPVKNKCDLFRTEKCNWKLKNVKNQFDFYYPAKKSSQPYSLLKNADCKGAPGQKIEGKLRIKSIFLSTVGECHKLCNDMEECKQFALGATGGYRNRCDLYSNGSCVFDNKYKFDFYQPSKLPVPKSIKKSAYCDQAKLPFFQIKDNVCKPIKKMIKIKDNWSCFTEKISSGPDKEDVTLAQCDTLCQKEAGCEWFVYIPKTKYCAKRKAGCENDNRKFKGGVSYRPTGYVPKQCDIKGELKGIKHVTSVQSCNDLCVATKNCRQFAYGRGDYLGACEMYRADLCTFFDKNNDYLTYDMYQPTNWEAPPLNMMIIYIIIIVVAVLCLCGCVIMKMKKNKKTAADGNELVDTAKAEEVHKDMKPPGE